jgi:hypothetical protein
MRSSGGIARLRGRTESPTSSPGCGGTRKTGRTQHGPNRSARARGRYDHADEYLEVLCKLWEGSCEDDAVLRDRERGIFTAAPTKVIQRETVSQIRQELELATSIPTQFWPRLRHFSPPTRMDARKPSAASPNRRRRLQPGLRNHAGVVRRLHRAGSAHHHRAWRLPIGPRAGQPAQQADRPRRPADR